MSLIFYYAPRSTATITDLVLEELELPCERVKVDLKKGETRSQEYLRLNPNGKVPLLVHDGTPIWESVAITMYLGELFGVERDLYPAPGPKRGAAMKWIAWANVTLGEAVGRLLRNTADWIPAEQRNAKAAEVAQSDLDNCLHILDKELVHKHFLTGTYTLADTHLNSLVDWLRFLKRDLSSYSHMNAWSQRCTARPAYGRVMSRR